LEGEADTLDITVEDTDGLFKDQWYPKKGQTLALEFGYEGQALQSAGLFEVDEIDISGPPDQVTIRGIATGVMKAFRTSQGRAYDNTTLSAIAQQVAKRLKLKLVGTIEAIQITRATQIYESDLAFLGRLAGEYGYAFSIKGETLIFYKRTALRSSAPVLTLKRTDLERYHIRDKIKDVAKAAQVSYHDAKTKRLKQSRVQQGAQLDTSDYEVKINVRAESDAQARVKAAAALDKANEDATQLELTVFGNPLLVAGINFMLADMGKLSGSYHVDMSRHISNRDSGYSTELEAKRVTSNG